MAGTSNGGKRRNLLPHRTGEINEIAPKHDDEEEDQAGDGGAYQVWGRGPAQSAGPQQSKQEDHAPEQVGSSTIFGARGAGVEQDTAHPEQSFDERDSDRRIVEPQTEV